VSAPFSARVFELSNRFYCTDCIACVQPGPRWVWLPVIARVLFIPFFMFCNVKPLTRSLPVLFGDYVYCVGSIVMAFTNGYFSSVVMMYAPRYVGYITGILSQLL